MKKYLYRGQIITASTRKEAVEIIAKKWTLQKGDRVGVSVETLCKLDKSGRTDLGYFLNKSLKYLKDKNGTVLCMDGETCVVKLVDDLGNVILVNDNGECNTSFALSKKESEVAIFK